MLNTSARQPSLPHPSHPVTQTRRPASAQSTVGPRRLQFTQQGLQTSQMGSDPSLLGPRLPQPKGKEIWERRWQEEGKHGQWGCQEGEGEKRPREG